MPIRPSQSRDAVAKLGRWVDLRVQVCLADVEAQTPAGEWRPVPDGDEVGDVRAELDGCRKRWRPGSDEVLGTFGGVWDRQKKCWARRHPLGVRAKVWRLHRGQEEAGRWLIDWLRRWGTRDWGGGYRRVWSAMLNSGRRAGKTHLAVVALVLFAAMKSRALTWVVSPTIETGAEIDELLQELLPRSWQVERVQASNGRSTTFRLPNGSRIVLKSGVNPDRLKAGGVDLAVYNEAQLQSHSGFMQLRGALADRGGLLVATSNPAGQPKGAWVEEHFHLATRGAADGVAFQLDNLKNPWIVLATLLSLRKEIATKDFNREVRGIFEAFGDVVMHAWRRIDHHRDPWPGLIDVTREVTARVLGRAVDFVLGLDFQVEPFMAATAHKLFRNPDAPAGTDDYLNWIIDEFVVEHSDEDGLLDEIESTPQWRADGQRLEAECYTAARCAVVMDASGWHQDSGHNRGQYSDKKLNARGWYNLHRPDKSIERNPLLKYRTKAGNAALKTADGKVRFFVALHCERTAESFAKWEMHPKLGIPSRTSKHTHLVDCGTYVEYRLRARPARKPRTPTYDRVELGRAAEVRGL